MKSSSRETPSRCPRQRCRGAQALGFAIAAVVLVLLLAPEPAGADAVRFDDTRWKSVLLPHDWAILGPIAQDNPGGGKMGYYGGGVGWYRKSFALPPGAEGKRVRVTFDGVYMNADVWMVPYGPEVLRAVAYRDGQPVAETTQRTAGTANRITFSVRGPLRLLGTENGNVLDHTPAPSAVRDAFMGMGLGIYQATDQAGPVEITVSADGLEPAMARLDARKQARTAGREWESVAVRRDRP
jgi:hypothetical protein